MDLEKLVEKVAKEAGIPKEKAQKAVTSVLDYMKEEDSIQGKIENFAAEAKEKFGDLAEDASEAFGKLKGFASKAFNNVKDKFTGDDDEEEEKKEAEAKKKEEKK